ncbi:hypothetical protein RRG08_065157 [Elysia crispata]|uniref:Uncharacterized protein n=1 Tax=Elysia crispata TaxID=231223 RepID=A0AAE1DHG1_9GAST|nr:hypothetical protein RRG08_065157 [Elysia crispata]
MKSLFSGADSTGARRRRPQISVETEIIVFWCRLHGSEAGDRNHCFLVQTPRERETPRSGGGADHKLVWRLKSLFSVQTPRERGGRLKSLFSGADSTGAGGRRPQISAETEIIVFWVQTPRERGGADHKLVWRLKSLFSGADSTERGGADHKLVWRLKSLFSGADSTGARRETEIIVLWCRLYGSEAETGNHCSCVQTPRERGGRLKSLFCGADSTGARRETEIIVL